MPTWLRGLAPALLAAAVVALPLSFFLLRRLWLRLVGPVFVYEAERVARKGRVFLVRALFAIAILGVLYAAFPSEEHLDLQVMNRFALDFSNAFSIAQSVVVMMLTPIYFAGAISDEKERRSFDFLLSTRLTSREITFGKFFSRLFPLLGIVLLPLPILAITQLWGGIDLPRILAGSAATMLSALSLGAFSMFCSVLARKTLPAIGTSYAVAIGFIAASFAVPPLDSMSNPISFQLALNAKLSELEEPAAATPMIVIAILEYALLHATPTLAFLLLSLLFMRKMAGRGLFSLIPTPTMAVTYTLGGGKKLVVRRQVRTYVPLPAMRTSPLLWKERHVGATVLGGTFHDVAWLVIGTIVLVAGGFAVYLNYFTKEESVAAVLILVVRGLMVLSAAYLMVSVGLNLAGCVSREREQQTLDSLLILPGLRSQILIAKWRGAWYRQRRAFFVVALALFFTLIGGRVHPLTFVLLPFALVAHVLFAAGLGLALSVACRSTTRANVAFLVTLVSIIAATWLAEYMLTRIHEKDTSVASYALPSDSIWDDDQVLISGIKMIDPIRGWWHLTKTRSKTASELYERYEREDWSYENAEYYAMAWREHWMRDAACACTGAIGYLILALMFLLTAIFKFRMTRNAARRIQITQTPRGAHGNSSATAIVPTVFPSRTSGI